MIDNPDAMSSYAGYAVGTIGLLLAIGQMAWQRFFSSEGNANNALVTQLSERITSQESRLVSLETGLDQEREARRRAEDKVHALEIDNLLLRAELRRHGIDVAAALAPSFATVIAP